jgi:hypothetical protein
MKKEKSEAGFVGGEKSASGMPKFAGKKVSPSSMKVKAAGPIAPKITSVSQIESYRKSKFGC